MNIAGQFLEARVGEDDDGVEDGTIDVGVFVEDREECIDIYNLSLSDALRLAGQLIDAVNTIRDRGIGD